MKIRENKRIIVEEDVVVKVLCDVCGKEINKDYFKISMTTNEHDEIDSDLCSYECVTKKFNEFLRLHKDKKAYWFHLYDGYTDDYQYEFVTGEDSIEWYEKE